MSSCPYPVPIEEVSRWEEHPGRADLGVVTEQRVSRIGISRLRRDRRECGQVPAGRRPGDAEQFRINRVFFRVLLDEANAHFDMLIHLCNRVPRP